MTNEDEFAAFVADVEPRLRRALVAVRGPDAGRDATAEALAWAWENWADVQAMANPAGYLYRVGQSRTRPRKQPVVPATPAAEPPERHLGLVDALADLSDRQRTIVVLVHACGWSYGDVAEGLGISVSSVGTHVQRALALLRDALEEDR